MKAIKKIVSVLTLFLMATNINAQSKQKDSLYVFKEFAKLGQLYKHLPVQLTIAIRNKANPVTVSSDTMQANMKLYFGKNDFYMQAEGLEEIINDSLMVLVNHKTKQIALYPNTQDIMKNIEKSASMFIPDSSVKNLARKYFSTLVSVGQNKWKIELRSKDMVYGTRFSKESINVTYKKNTYETSQFSQTKVNLLPVDSTVYNKLRTDEQNTNRLISFKSSKGNLFFLVKELTTTYTFKKVDYNILKPFAQEQDRVVKTNDGSYMLAKGFEEYVLTKEF